LIDDPQNRTALPEPIEVCVKVGNKTGVGVDTGPPGADNTSAMHAQTAHQPQTAGAQQMGMLSVAAAVPPVSSLPVTALPVVVSALVSISGIVIICPAGGVLG
jgi:hypothetical protein